MKRQTCQEGVFWGQVLRMVFNIVESQDIVKGHRKEDKSVQVQPRSLVSVLQTVF